MYLSDLALSDFRNYADAVVHFEPGVTTLVGSNGQGKTNLVEAIAYLSTLDSHRVSSDAALVRAGAPGAVVRARVVSGGRAATVEVEIVPGRANRARVNRAAARPREVLGLVRTVVFAPEDIALVKGDPAERRRFLDEIMVARAPRLAGVRSEYDRILRQRSALLKSGGRRLPEAALATLDVWDGHLARAAAEITRARAALARDLQPLVRDAYGAVSDRQGEAGIALRASLEQAEEQAAGGGGARLDAADLGELAARYEAAMRHLRPQELDRGVCLVGPHRDDLLLSVGSLPAKGYASHGESWSLALALRMATFHLLRSEDPAGETPILILDDVFAELDARRRAQLAGMVGAAQQVFITAAVAEDVPAELAGARFRVVDGTVAPEHQVQQPEERAEEVS